MLPEIFLLFFLIGFFLGAILCALLLFTLLSKRHRAQQRNLRREHTREQQVLNQGRERVMAILEQRTGELKMLEREHSSLQARLAEIYEEVTTAVANPQAAYADQEAQFQAQNRQLEAQNRQLQEELLLQNNSLQHNTTLIDELQICQNELVAMKESGKAVGDKLLFATKRLQKAIYDNQIMQNRLQQQPSPSLPPKERPIGLGFAALDALQPVHAIRLFEHNIQSLHDLSQQEPENVAQFVNVSLTQAAEWISQSQVFLKQDQELGKPQKEL